MARSTHRLIRDAVAVALADALVEANVDLPVKAMDVPSPRLIDLPGVIVWLGGDEQHRGGTNARDDIAYPVTVGLFTVTADPDPDRPGNDPPGLHPSDFRAMVRQLFHNRRAVADIDGVSLFPSEVDFQPPILDTVSPDAIDQLRTAVGVTVTAREPRGVQ